MAFAVREWILRDHHDIITNDLKFIARKGMDVKLFHNIWINRWNRRFLRENISVKVPNIELERVPTWKWLYEHILSTKQNVDKLIILERQYLIWDEGKRINTISTDKLQKAIKENDVYNLWISNTNFMWDLLKICKSVEAWNVSRVHVLPAGRKNAIKHELFSIEGSGTLIGNNFWNPEIQAATEDDEDIILWVLKSSKSLYLKTRSKQYIQENITNFHIAKIDNIPVWCVEIISIDSNTIELWALAVIQSFLSLKIGITLIKFIESIWKKQWKHIISLTNNKKLQDIYTWRWFEKESSGKYIEREKRSPWVQIFLLKYENIV